MSDLKPCPFCGGKPVLVAGGVACGDTHRCPMSPAAGWTDPDVWNRRAPLTVADCLDVPEVRKLINYLMMGHSILPTSALLAPFLAAMEGKR